MKIILSNEIKMEMPNSQALGSFNSALASSHIGFINVSGGSLNKDLLEHTARQMKSLGINENIKIKLVNLKNNVGQVRLNENSNKVASIEISKQAKGGVIKEFIAHELTHVKQINNGDLQYKNGGVIWKGKEVMTKKEFEKHSRVKTSEDYKRYKSVAWEKEAYKRGDKYKL
jgi:hypothetical protein